MSSSKFAEQYKRLGMEVPTTSDPGEKFEAIYQAACAKVGLDPADQPDVSRCRDKYRAHQVADYKLIVIRDGITDDREANWNDIDEDKYGGWFWMNKPGFRLYDVLCDSAVTRAGLGSRLCTFSDDDQEFFMKECIAGWADFMGAPLKTI